VTNVVCFAFCGGSDGSTAARIANALADWERQQQAAEPPAAAGAPRAPQMKPGAKFLMPVQG
jgi:hypothetical protein